VLHDALEKRARGNPDERYASWIAQFDTLGDADLAAMKEEQSRFAESPLFSVLVPIEHGKAVANLLTTSLRAQVYERWDPLSVRASTAEDCNRVLRSAEGNFVVIAAPGVALRPHSLFLFARTLERHPSAVLIYGDDDVLDERGVRSGHFFKPDWNEALLRSQNYLGVVCLRRSSALAVGGFDEGLDDDHGWGLFLKLSAAVPLDAIQHVPFVVSHRLAGAAAHERRLTHPGGDLEVEPVGKASYRVRYSLPQRPPPVSIIVPSTCELKVLRPCVDGLLERTAYPELEVVIVANQVPSPGRETRRYLDSVAASPRARVLSYERPSFNFSAINNWAADQVRGELLCFLNDDTEVIEAGWLSAMVAYAVQDRIAAVGAKLLYPNDRIQHAGIVLGAGGVAAHVYRGSRNGIDGYHDRAVVDQDVAAVSAACMLVRRHAFDAVGGFDEAFAVAYNDIDLCLRLRRAGWRIVWTPSAALYHKEAASLGDHYVGATAKQWETEFELIRSRWEKELVSDPHYSPNLSLDPLLLWEPAFPPRVSYPWRAVASLPR
jgi:hypothetical protein